MNSLQISDVTNYDFRLLGSEIQLVVHQPHASTTIHLFPSPNSAISQADQPQPTTQELTPSLPAAKTIRRKKRKARKQGGSSNSRKYGARTGRINSLGVAVASKLSETEVRMIRELWPDALKGSPSKRQALLHLAEMFDISAPNIDQIVRGITWKHLL